MSVLSADDVDGKFVRNLPDALAETAGVMVQKSANGQGAPFLRGFTGYRMLTVIDGVRYNNSVYRDGPNEYFSLIDMHAVSSLEVLGGPTSAMYGSDAIGGTVVINTRSSGYEHETHDETFIHGRQRIAFASVDNSRQSRTEIAVGSGGHYGLHLGYSLKHFGDLRTADLGQQPHTGYGEAAWDARIDWQVSERWEARLVYQQLEQDDVWRTFSTRLAQPFAGTSVGTDERRVKDQQRELGYVRVQGHTLHPALDSLKVTLSRQVWREDGDRVRAGGERNLEAFDSIMLGADIQFDSRLGFLDLVYGLDIYHDGVDSSRRDFAPDGSLAQVRIQGPIGDDANYEQRGVYIQGLFAPLEQLQIDLSSRYNDVSATIGRFEDPVTGDAASFSDSWTEVVSSARVSVSPFVRHPVLLWSGVSQAFRAPNIADLSRFGASRSNEIEIAATDLDAEQFLTFEVGLRVTEKQHEFSLVGYHTRIRDFITSTATGNLRGGQVEVSKQNSGSGFVRGVEVAARREWRNGFSVWGNLTWLESELDAPESIATSRIVSEPLSRTMPLTTNFGLRWERPQDGRFAALDVSIVARADQLSRGDRRDINRIPPGGTPGYEFVRASVGQRLGAHFDIALAVNNVFDNRYRSHGSGVNAAGLGVDLRLTASY